MDDFVSLDQAKRAHRAAAGDEPVEPGTTDDALALVFAGRFADQLRYVAFWGKWMEWDGSRWAVDNTRHAYDLVRHLLRETAAQHSAPATRHSLESAKKATAVHNLAQVDRRIAAESDGWDPNHDVFNEGDEE